MDELATQNEITTNVRNRLIDIIKGICIILVIFTHYGWTTEQWHKMLFPFWVDMAVPMFMVISGYVGSISFIKKNFDSFHDFYSCNVIIPKILRFVIPFIIVLLIEFIADSVISKTINPKELIYMFFIGGKGPGSYYFPVMIQFIFIFPLIYLYIQRNGICGLLHIFIVNALFEFVQKIWGMDEEVYRLLILRYVFVIGFGRYLAVKKEDVIRKIWVILCAIIGLGFIILVEYTAYNPKIIVYWTRTSFVACLYIMPFSWFLFRSNKNYHFVPLEIVGKSSFNIFLTQMVYFYYLAPFVYSYIQPLWLRLLINFSCCILFGVVFYFGETTITKKIINNFKKSNINFNNKLENIFLEKNI